MEYHVAKRMLRSMYKAGAQPSRRRSNIARADIEMTRVIVEVAKPLGIAVHDHIIVGRTGTRV
jgi:DNA repair protein RadC